MTERDPGRHRRAGRALLLSAPIGLFALFALQGEVLSSDGRVDHSPVVAGSDDVPTFSRDVAPLLQASCEQCHRAEGMAPMSLVTYDEVRPWAGLIKDRVVNRIMPPWHLDKTVGIQEYANDPSLSDEEIDLIVRWVDGGTPQGDPADLPPALDWPAGGAWQLAETLGREPDLILRSAPFTLEADGMDQWWRPTVEFEGFDDERWIMGVEFKPAYPLGIQVVHHGHANLSQEGQRTKGVARYGVGKRWEIFPEDTGMRIVPGPGRINWDLHYWPSGEKVEDDVVEAGLWFHPAEAPPKHETLGEVFTLVDRSEQRPRGVDILIPPHGYQTLQGTYLIQNPAVLHSFRPHMHMRGKEMSVEALYPDGRREVLGKVDRYDHFWQIAYQFADHVKPLLPRGTILLMTSTFDNTVNNPVNPDPDQWVAFGQRSVDEMSHVWLGLTYVDDETFEGMVAEREMRRRSEFTDNDD